ncbi:MAG: HEAT repeat domain-containing protein [Pseudomonadota bacterium]
MPLALHRSGNGPSVPQGAGRLETLPALDRRRMLEAVPALVRQLEHGSDVLRCAAARVLGLIGDPSAAPALVEALLDEDEDVRMDAMAALETCARPEDGEAILRSLEGDPLPEVKVSALRSLARLGAKEAVPRLRALVSGRCDDDVAWDEENGYWDDWLDVQAEAIRALGRLGASEAIGDLLAARSDEMGQELDDVVLPALVAMPGGAKVLLSLIEGGAPRTRQRALLALADADRAELDPLSERLLTDPSPEVRVIAIGICTVPAARLASLASSDAAASVRCAALERLGSDDQAAVLRGLRDPDEALRAVALSYLLPLSRAETQAELSPNIEAWAFHAGADLAAAATRHLPAFLGKRALEVLSRLAQSIQRPLRVRLLAVEMLTTDLSPEAVEVLETLLAAPERQLRAAAIAGLARHASGHQQTLQARAHMALLAALDGQIVPAKADGAEASKPGIDPALGPTEAAEGRLHITPDGDIEVRRTEDATTPEGSTLASLQAAASDARPQTEQPRRQRKRVVVEGDGGDPNELVANTLRIAAALPSAEIEDRIRKGLDNPLPEIARAAAEAMALRVRTCSLSADAIDALSSALKRSDPVVRAHAARALISAEAAPDRLEVLLEDQDAITRSLVVDALSPTRPEIALHAIDSNADVVARTAARQVIAHSSPADVVSAFRRCVEQAKPSPAAILIAGSAAVWSEAAAVLDRRSDTSTEKQVILAALEQCFSDAARSQNAGSASPPSSAV